MDNYTQHMRMDIDNICDLCNFHSKDLSMLEHKSNLQDIQIMDSDIVAHKFYLLNTHRFHEWPQDSGLHILECMNQQTIHQGIMKCKFCLYSNQKSMMQQDIVKRISMSNYLQNMGKDNSLHKDLLIYKQTSH